MEDGERKWRIGWEERGEKEEERGRMRIGEEDRSEEEKSIV